MLQQPQIHLCDDYHLSGKIILIKRNHQFNLDFFFSNGNFPSRICCDFLRAAFEYLLFQSEFSTEQPPLENRKFFRVVTFQNSYLFDEGIVQNKYIYRRATFSKMIPLYSINFFRRATFQKKANFSGKQYSALPTFSGELIFQSVSFFKRRYLLLQLPFQKNYFFLQHTYSEE